MIGPRLDARSEEIMRLVVRTHVGTSRPVGSGTVARSTAERLSPATVRHLMAELEKAGYLYQPHVSAGRLPTKKGYRYFVDLLLPRGPLGASDQALVRSTLGPMRGDRPGLLEGTSRLLSRLSQQIGMVLEQSRGGSVIVDGTEVALRQPEFTDIEMLRALFLALQRRGALAQVLNRCMGRRGLQVHIGPETLAPDLSEFTLVVSTYGPRDRPLGSLGILGPIRMEYDRVIPVVEYVSSCFSRLLTGPTH